MVSLPTGHFFFFFLLLDSPPSTQRVNAKSFPVYHI